jgi:hypothetical protein
LSGSRKTEYKHGILFKQKAQDQRTCLADLYVSCLVIVSWQAFVTPWVQIGAALLLMASAREWALAERQATTVQKLALAYLALTTSSIRSGPQE